MATEEYRFTRYAVVDEQYPDVTLTADEYIRDGDDEWTLTPNIAWSREGQRRRIYVQFEKPPVDYRSIQGVYFYMTYSFTGNSAGTRLKYSFLSDPDSFDITRVTWNNQPTLSESIVGSLSLNPSQDLQRQNVLYGFSNKNGRDIITPGIFAIELPEGVSGSFRIASYYFNSYSPSQSQYLSQLSMNVGSSLTSYRIQAFESPTSGYINKFAANTFSWQFYPTNAFWSTKIPKQSSATFGYRTGTSGAWFNEVLEDEMSYTVPANTFTGTQAQWEVSALAEGSTQGTSIGPFTLSTAAAAMTAVPLSPNANIEDSRGDIIFVWTSSSADGGAQTAATIQYSEDASTWTTLATISGAATQTTIAGSRLPTGTVYWRVRGRNADNVYGPYSDPVSFICIGAPAAPIVSAQPVDFAVINWQADEQSAYRITIDGRTVVTAFGTTRTFSLDDPLPLGSHTVSVEVQNSFGLWSQPGSATFTVSSNTYEKPVITKRKFGADFEMSYSIESSSLPQKLYVYRDGVKIATLNRSQRTGTFSDRRVLGAHSYQIVQRMSDGRAVYSVEVNGTMKVRCPLISLLSGGEWLKLRFSEISQRAETFVKTKNVSLNHFTGAVFPVAETGPYEDESGTYDVSFDNIADAEAFESLYGKPVILKTKADNVLVGVLAGYQKSVYRFYVAYTFTIQRIHWRDYRDLSAN